MDNQTAENERARLAALYRYEILDTEPQESFDRITRITKTDFHDGVVGREIDRVGAVEAVGQLVRLNRCNRGRGPSPAREDAYSARLMPRSFAGRNQKPRRPGPAGREARPGRIPRRPSGPTR